MHYIKKVLQDCVFVSFFYLGREEMVCLVLICTQDGAELQRRTDGLAAQRSPFADPSRLFLGM